MRPFVYSDTASQNQAANTKFLAGGTTLIDLMKLDVERPEHVVDLNRAAQGLKQIEAGSEGLRLGALVTMAEAAETPEIKSRYPVIAQSLMLAASQQIRNMASLSGNVLQRTRCAYFRDVSYPDCNKRNPGSGCAAIGGVNRQHAVLGTSDACIATYPGDFAQALIALDAQIETDRRRLPFAELHRPANEPHIENTLQPGELIRSFIIPAGDFRRSLYLKIRDRESYQFALTSAAVAFDLDGDQVSNARIALGGVAYRPWRAREAEAELNGKALDETSAGRAAEAAFAGAKGYEHNKFKIETGKQTLIRALLEAKALEI
jgi:xanthine dehydrogenase YagS FAD-binding subunit